jgi:nicotinamide riboside kinase
MHTTVINLYGGPGTGKSTLSAELFHKMKRQGLEVELVREYVKDWAWDGRQIKKFDQIYLLAKQARRESVLYGKVQYIITDSPITLAGFYAEHYLDQKFVTSAAKAFLELARGNEVDHRHYFLKRFKKYNPKGRYETEEQALDVDVKMRQYLTANEIPYVDIDSMDQLKADHVLKTLIYTAS